MLEITSLLNNKYINYLVDSVVHYPLSTVRDNFDNFKYSFFEKYPEYFELSKTIEEEMNISSLSHGAFLLIRKHG